MIRVLLVDDHAAFRQPLAFMLDREPDIVVVGQAGSIAEARLFSGSVDIVLLDLDLPDGNGVELMKDLHAAGPQTDVLILTGNAARIRFAQAVEAGATAVMPKTSGLDEIIGAVRRIHGGESLLGRREMIDLLRLATQQREQDRAGRQAISRLTPREREVLQALAAGLSDKGIADRLYLSHQTVRTHMVNVMGKLGAESRLQALVVALRHGVVTLDPEP